MYASPEHDADLLYWSRIAVCDRFLAFEVEGRRYAISNYLEKEVMEQHSGFDEVLLPNDLTQHENPSLIDLIKIICEKFPTHDLRLPKNFPAHLILKLQERNIPFTLQEGEFLPERAIKLPAEVEQIKKACTIIIKAFEHIRSILSRAKVVDKILYDHGEILTSERLRSEIGKVCFEGGAIAKETIVACGKDAACPHHRGIGMLHANEFIVVDIFPRLIESGYHGDMTRTFLKGEPSEDKLKMYNAVKKVQSQAIEEICAGKNAKEIHAKNIEMFTNMGYISNDSSGFFHGTGHGVGLDLHESPSINTHDHILQVGEVVTVEPGLYYPHIGGVRIEDVILVHEERAELLSNFSYDWVV
jgi:Xaa-Pro aminopeptidase